LSLANATFTLSNGTKYTWAQALSNGKQQAYLAYYDSSSASLSERKYKYLSTESGLDDTAFRNKKGYWLYANQSGNLTLPGVGGTTSGQTYAYSKLRVMNSTGSEVSIADARTLGWLFGTSPENYINYKESDVWKYICEDEDLCHLVVLNSWQGYFIYSNQDNIILVRQN